MKPYLVLGLALLTGCASLRQDESLASLDNPEQYPLSGNSVCIVKEHQPQIADLNGIIHATVKEMGFATFSLDDEDQATGTCDFVLLYRAERHWDVLYYLSSASFRLLKEGAMWRYVEYRSSEGIDFDKYEPTASKVRRTLTILFKEVRRGAPGQPITRSKKSPTVFQNPSGMYSRTAVMVT